MTVRFALRAVFSTAPFAIAFCLCALLSSGIAQAQSRLGATHLAGHDKLERLPFSLADARDNPPIVRVGWRTKTQTTGQIERSQARMRKTTPNQPASKLRRQPSSKTGSPASKVTKGNYHYRPAAPSEAANWPYSEVQIARARCQHILASIKAEVELVAPIKKGPCGDPAPVRLRSLGSKPKVAIDPPALLNCDMVASLHDWLTKDLQPAARRILKTPITKIETMSSYSCRNAYGRKNARLSQHGLANAMDIRGFETAKKGKTRLAAHWGPTARDIRATQLAAQRKREKKRKTSTAVASAALGKAADGSAQKQAEGTLHEEGPQEEQVAAADGINTSTAGVVGATMRPSLLEGMSSLFSRGLAGGAGGLPSEPSFGVAPNKLGGPAVARLGLEAKQSAEDDTKPEPSWPVVLASTRANISQAQTPRARFLRLAHETGCKRFGTILGPEANYAHHNHFHVDLARRKMGSYCK